MGKGAQGSRRRARRTRHEAFQNTLYGYEWSNRSAAQNIPRRIKSPRRAGVGYDPAEMRAILFDFNGVLVDDESFHFETMQRVFREEGITLTEPEYFSDYLGLNDRNCITAILERHDLKSTADVVSRLVARKAAYYQMQIRLKGLPQMPGAADLIKEAYAAGWSLGVVTGALRAEVEGALRQMDLTHCFKTVVTADEVPTGKPDPEGYRRGLQELNSLPPLPARLFHPHEVLVIEDSPLGLKAARALGMPTLGVASTQPAERLAEADEVLASMLELSVKKIDSLFPFSA